MNFYIKNINPNFPAITNGWIQGKNERCALHAYFLSKKYSYISHRRIWSVGKTMKSRSDPPLKKEKNSSRMCGPWLFLSLDALNHPIQVCVSRSFFIHWFFFFSISSFIVDFLLAFFFNFNKFCDVFNRIWFIFYWLMNKILTFFGRF